LCGLSSGSLALALADHSLVWYRYDLEVDYRLKMPHLRLETNIPKSKITEDFLKQTTALMAKTLGKPESVSYAFKTLGYVTQTLN
jgi:hypothetical protein